jgi:hypothetical protein
MSTPLYDKSCIFRQKKTAHKNVPLKKPFPTPEKWRETALCFLNQISSKKLFFFKAVH